MTRLAVRTLLITLALAVSTLLGGLVTVALFGDLGIPLPETNPLPWQIASYVIIAATLLWVAMRSRISGGRLALCLGILYFGLSHFNSIIEARFFGLFDSRQYAAVLIASAVADAILVLALLPILRGLEPRERAAEWSVRFSALRIAAGAFAYLITYFVAGMIVYPFVRDFYEGLGRPLPDGRHVIAMQLLIRGPVFVALSALLVRMSAASRRETILMTGGALTLLGGVALLIVPNALIPDSARWPHFVEVVSSNFVYGCFLGWLLTKRLAPAEAPASLSPAGAGS